LSGSDPPATGGGDGTSGVASSSADSATQSLEYSDGVVEAGDSCLGFTPLLSEDGYNIESFWHADQFIPRQLV